VIRKGEAWGHPATGAPDATGHGGDAALGRLVAHHEGALLQFVPDPACDLARAVGLTTESVATTEVVLDALRVDTEALSVNMIVLGVPPDRLRWWHRTAAVTVRVDGRTAYEGPATTVVIANGQYLRGHDVVPRGHPGDGRGEVQVYWLRPGERAAMRRRLRGGVHVPHPRITSASGRWVEVSWARRQTAEVDGTAALPRTAAAVEVVPGAYRLLV
jgi:diacylglycerol kinase family enzyme